MLLWSRSYRAALRAETAVVEVADGRRRTEKRRRTGDLWLVRRG